MINSDYVLRLEGGILKHVGVDSLGWDAYGDHTVGLQGSFPDADMINRLPGKTIEIAEREGGQIVARIEVGTPILKTAYDLVPAKADDVAQVTMAATFKCAILQCDFFFGFSED